MELLECAFLAARNLVFFCCKYEESRELLFLSKRRLYLFQAELHKRRRGGWGGVCIWRSGRWSSVLDGGGVVVLERETVMADLLLRHGRVVYYGSLQLCIQRFSLSGVVWCIQIGGVHSVQGKTVLKIFRQF